MRAEGILATLTLILAMALPAAADSLQADPPDSLAVPDSVTVVKFLRMDDSGVTLEEEEGESSVEEKAPRRRRPEKKGPAPRSVEKGEGQFFFKEDVSIAAGESLHDDAVVMFGDLDVSGTLNGDVVVIMGDLSVLGEGEIIGDAVCLGGEIYSDSTAKMRGEVVSIPFGALLTGKGWDVLINLSEGEGGSDLDVVVTPRSRLSRFFEALGNLLGMLFVGLMTLLIFRGRVSKATGGMANHPWKSLLFGFLGLLAGLLLAFPVLLTLVLVLAFLAVVLSPIWPLMLVVVVAYVLCVAVIFAGIILVPGLLPIMTFSRLSWEKKGMNAFASVILWILIIWAFWTVLDLAGGFVAGLGNLSKGLFYIFGLGSLIVTRMGTRRLAAAAAPAPPPMTVPPDSTR